MMKKKQIFITILIVSLIFSFNLLYTFFLYSFNLLPSNTYLISHGEAAVFSIDVRHPDTEDSDGDNVFRHIQEAIKVAANGDELIAEKGTYSEHIDFLGKAITLRSTIPDDPNIVTGTVIEQGSVSFKEGETGSSMIKGFYVQKGEGFSIICSSPSIINCIISENIGDCGGGMYCWNASPSIKNCTFEKNQSNTGCGGGGIYAEAGSALTLTNCVIHHNTAGDWADGGGGICARDSSLTVINCTIAHNNVGLESMYGGGGICCPDSSLTIINSIVWGNTSISCDFNDIECENGEWDNNWGGCCTTSADEIAASGVLTNISSFIGLDPLFINPTAGDYHLTPESPCLDKGTKDASPTTDKDGNPRPFGAGYDPGAYEYWECEPSVSCTFFRDLDGDGFGDPNAPITHCTTPDQYVLNTDDCNDHDPNINAMALEICDGVDNNCNSQVDEGCSQTIPLQTGWNLISFQVSKCYYDQGVPTEFIPAGVEMIGKENLAEWLSSDSNSPLRDPDDPNQAADWQRILSFDRQGAHILDKSLPPFVNTFHYLSLGYGYWIKMNKPGTLVMSGQRASSYTALELNKGWNLTGFIPSYTCYGKNPMEAENICPYHKGIYQAEEGINYRRLDQPIETAFSTLAGLYKRIISFDTCSGAMIYDPLLPSFVNTLNYVGPKYGLWIKMEEAGQLIFP